MRVYAGPNMTKYQGVLFYVKVLVFLFKFRVFTINPCVFYVKCYVIIFNLQVFYVKLYALLLHEVYRV